MENQINNLDQGSQEISQNPLSQMPNPLASEKSRNYLLISAISILLLVIISTTIFFFKYKKQAEPEQNANIESTSIVESDPNPTTSTVTPIESTNNLLIGNIAFIRGDNLWVINNGLEKQLTNDAIPAEIPYWSGLPKLWYSNPQISPDGRKIAYLKNTSSRSLLVADIDGQNVKELANDVEWTMPLLQWTSDSQQIYYPSPGGVDSVIVRAVNVNTEQKLDYGRFDMLSGCGGGSPDPADHLAASENITSVGGGVQAFDLSTQNNFIVHTILCTGDGFGILDLSSKQDKQISDNATKATVSPDGERIAAILESNIVIFDKSGKTLETFPTEETPEVLLWDSAGKVIYYSSSELVKNLDFDEELALEVLGSSPASFKVNRATMWKLSLDSKKSEKIKDFDAHNLKAIYANEQKLLLIVVENATALYTHINQYKTNSNAAQYYPKVRLEEVNLSNLSSTTVADQVQQASFMPE